MADFDEIQEMAGIYIVNWISYAEVAGRAYQGMSSKEEGGKDELIKE